ncbi:MAG TPA: DUF1508 domain-containing protein [Candidatus Binatia bacterium]|nr:DUF1508 domain-containing protein [Candidatus Binatia bacterium]
MKGRFEVYRGRNGLWFTRFRAGNNQVVMAGEGYTRRRDAVLGCRRMQRAIRMDGPCQVCIVDR